jgi:3-hydroxyacyl-CoA dehydrogenase/enoyl-CoA hydratase/3-hydroxybutyryl-CoA epimerase/enoyl-CoA isomerase
MLFDGKAIQVEVDKNEILHFIFDMKEGSANVIGKTFLDELPNAIEATKKSGAKGILYRSNKEHFIFGADITEFSGHFQKSQDEIKSWILETNKQLNQLEDLPIPSVVAINGFALGGGFEVCLLGDYRVAAAGAKVGLPETKLGIMPGWGGSVRLPRISGADHAIEWITSGKQYKAEDAMKIGVIDAVVPGDKLIEAATATLERAIKNELPWNEKRTAKLKPLRLNKTEATMTFETAKGFVAGVAGKNYPAPVKAVQVMQDACGKDRDGAIDIEAAAFAELAKTDVAESLIQVFMADQYLKKVSKKVTKGADKVSRAAVLGAGIMGGGIAYQSASKGTPIVMKDINDQALELGLNEASKLLNKQITRKRITPDQMAQTLNAIVPTLSYGDFGNVDLVVEAVVENLDIKKKVLADLENNISDDTVVATNTSTLTVNDMATALKRPENFTGMHFFNPVHRMPLVEVIRGEKSSDRAVAATVQYALQMGKTPIVVKDCNGFLVNRILFPYFIAFNKLIADGADFNKVDKAMEKFGWPMGPAYLLDVVGLDTGRHCLDIVADAYPDRMKDDGESIVHVMFDSNRYGQKNGLGFYKYEKDKKGRPKKIADGDVPALISKVASGSKDFSEEEIIERMMLPMIFEAARCLEDEIVGTPQEVDMGLLLGLGFPPFRAGALKYADRVGLNKIIEQAKKYESVGAIYNVPNIIVEKAKENKTFY